ncbi:MAG: 50S ribosomal protein L25 [Opitutales bacterium]|nr:50S ribosomal protein L25 [Opitutales bacterium]
MKQINLNVSNRDSVGGTTAKRYRKEGKIPAVIYGESGCKNLLVDEKTFEEVAKSVVGKAALIEIHFSDGTESRYAMLKEVVRNTLSGKAEHIDFKEVVRGKPMNAVVPLHFQGEAEGVKNENGVLDIQLHEIGIRCRPRDLPEFIAVDVSAMHVGDIIVVSGLKLPEGVEIHGAHADMPVVSCVAEAKEEEPAAEAEAPADAAAAPAEAAKQ